MKEHVHIAVYAKECHVELSKGALGFISLIYQPEDNRLGVNEKTQTVFSVDELLQNHFQNGCPRVYLFHFTDSKNQMQQNYIVYWVPEDSSDEEKKAFHDIEKHPELHPLTDAKKQFIFSKREEIENLLRSK